MGLSPMGMSCPLRGSAPSSPRGTGGGTSGGLGDGVAQDHGRGGRDGGDGGKQGERQPHRSRGLCGLCGVGDVFSGRAEQVQKYKKMYIA